MAQELLYGSCALTDIESRYSQTGKRPWLLFGNVRGLLCMYMVNSFDLVTDHKSLEVIFGPHSKSSARIQSFVLCLMLLISE
jgi:hypothetical protein